VPVLRGTPQGKLARCGWPDGGKALAAIVQNSEAIDDLIGRMLRFAQLVYTGDTTDPVRAKFFGDVQERITTSSSHLLFFSLEAQPDRRQGAGPRHGGAGGSAITAVDRGRPQGKALSARGSPSSSSSMRNP